MKCPRCWAEKAYVHPPKGWRRVLLECLFLTRMKCHHCYHKFLIPWFFTIGQEVTPPPRDLPHRRSGDGPSTVPFRRPHRATGRKSRPGRGNRADAA